MAESIGQKMIAEKAGVSRTTVSVVLNNRSTPVISEKTRRRVLKVAKSMGYRPRPKISYQTGTHNLGIFLSAGIAGVFANPVFGPIFDGIQQEAAQNDFHLILAMPEARMDRNGPTLIRDNKCDGVLLLGPARERLLEIIRTDQTPAVAIGDAPKDVEAVVADGARAARLAVAHLTQMGHEKIGYIHSNCETVMAKEQFDAFRLAIFDHDLELQRRFIFDTEGGADAADALADSLIDQLGEFTALVCCDDATALGVMAGLRRLGKQVPRDLSIIGMDDVSEARRAGLTTINVPKEDMGRLAVKKLLARISGEDAPASRSVVPVALVQRDSVANLKPIPASS